MKISIPIAVFCFALFPTYSLALSDDDLKSAIEEARRAYEAMLGASGSQSPARPPSLKEHKWTPQTLKMSELAAIHLSAVEILVTKYGIDRDLALKRALEAKQEACEFPKAPRCDPTEKYRRFNGSCNNLQNPNWGSIYEPLERVVSPVYEGPNGDEPRGGLISTLPPSRHVSLQVHIDQLDSNNETPEVTHMVAQFGQFFDHDITLTAEGGKPCCDANQNDPDCWPIMIDPQDFFYGQYNVQCLAFTRSTATCARAAREQLNLITSFVDASNVYGSEDRLAKQLRRFIGGELEENSEVSGGFLPWRKDVDPNSELKTVVAGDRRVSEMPGLTVMHILFSKEHNRIAHEFQTLTTWDDERIFQETRRIVVAEMQQITYSEYLPTILGSAAMQKYSLSLGSGRSIYDPKANPNIFNAFATAAYRFGHTLVSGLIQMWMGEQQIHDQEYHFQDHYFRSDIIIEGGPNMPGYAKILKGLTKQMAQQGDGIISQDMTNHLFRNSTEKYGSDLAARNIQRGRDHGLPGYNTFRRYCGLQSLTNWETRPLEIPQLAWDRLKLAYRVNDVTGTVDDIDLYTGGLSESLANGGQAGPTFVCLMGEQFASLKFGDRFFFTHLNQTGSFTDDQLLQLRSRRLSDIMCENSNGGFEALQLDVFHPYSQPNPLTPCNDPLRPKLNLTLFTDISTSSGARPNNAYSLLTLMLLTLFGGFTFTSCCLN